MNLYLKIVLLSVAICFMQNGVAQNTITSKKSTVKFDGGTNIEAENSNSKFIIRDSDDSIVSLIPIKDFIFPNSLMQEHFNENYMESDKYPEASFSGKLIDFNKDEINAEKKSFEAVGKMTIHGVTKKIKLPVLIHMNSNGDMELQSTFKIELEDYKIKIPKIMFVKIAEVADVNIACWF